MDVLQLLCFMVREWIKGTFNFCVVWSKNDFILLVCAAECMVRGFSLMEKALRGFHAVDPVRIYYADSFNLPCVRILYKRTFDATNQFVTGIICTKAHG